MPFRSKDRRHTRHTYDGFECLAISYVRARIGQIRHISNLKWKNSDDYMPPFAIFTVPHEALHASSAVPTLRELRLFTQGMAVGAAQFESLALSLEFLQWTYEHYVAAPLKIGNKVEVNLKQQMV